MALPVPPGGTPASPPVVGAGGPPGQPPFGGAGGASMPTPNKGAEANGTALIQVAIKVLEKVIPMVGVTSEIGKDVIKSLNTLAKIAPPGSGSPGVEQNAMQNLMLQQKQDNPMLQQMAKPQAGPPPGAPPGGAPMPGM
jgi:hypothetical protein